MWGAEKCKMHKILMVFQFGLLLANEIEELECDFLSSMLLC